MATDSTPGIPIILHCPGCSERHIDRGEFAMRPHHTHACQLCGIVWRPAVVNTVGVQFLPNFKDPEVAYQSYKEYDIKSPYPKTFRAQLVDGIICACGANLAAHINGGGTDHAILFCP